jgi:type I restriction enzyme S subunit
MSEWKEYRLSDIASIENKRRIPLNSQQRSEMQGSFPYYGASGVVDYVNDYIFDGQYVLISEDGENLRSRQTPIAFLVDGQFWVNNHAHILKGNDELVNEFIVYYFQNLNINPFIAGAVQPKLNLENLLSIPIFMPDREERLELTRLLNSLTRKIENLRKQNETLEAIAQTLFKHWFVDCEFPNEDGKPYKSSGGEMVRSELGDIPVGWRVGKLGDFGKVITGKTPSTQNPDYWGNGLPFITPTDFKNYRKFVLNSEREISKLAVLEFKNLIVPEKSVVVTCIGSDMGKVARTATRCITNQQLNSLVFCQIKHGIEYVYQFLVSQYKMLRLMALGGSTMPIINKTAFSNIEIVIPDLKTLDKFNEIIEPFNLKVINNEQQIQTLAQTRDVLLPKLMSGKFRITE